MDFHYNRWHLFCQSVFLFLSPLLSKIRRLPYQETAGSIVGTTGAEGKHAESHRRERPMCRSAAWQIQSVWITGTTPRHIIPSERSEPRNLPKLHVLPCVGTFLPRGGFLHYGRNDNDGTFLRIRLQFLECFTLPRPLISLGCAEPASPKGSFCTVLSGIGFIETPQGSSQYLPQRGRGTARRRWMRGGTALRIVTTTGAKVNLPSLTVGNGLCAVPLRCNYNPCGQTGTTPDMSFRDRSESRNLPKLQILSCAGSSSHVVDSSTTVGMTMMLRFYEFAYSF